MRTSIDGLKKRSNCAKRGAKSISSKLPSGPLNTVCEDVRVLDVLLPDVLGADALDGERSAALAVEQRADDEARVGPRPAQPLHGSLAEKGVVRAVPDDAEAVGHGGAVAGERRLYTRSGTALSREAHWPEASDTRI